MIPTRSTLATWRVADLAAAGATIAAAGEKISTTTWDARTSLRTLGVEKSWTGLAAEAANSAFARTDRVAAGFELLGENTGKAIDVAHHDLLASKRSIDTLVAGEAVCR